MNSSIRSDWRKLLVVTPICLVLGGCGGSDSSGGAASTSTVSLGFSDAPVDSAEAVVITVDSITFVGPDGDIVVDQFTSESLNLNAADTFQIDLLTLQGAESKLVIDAVELPVGQYQNLRIGVIDEDVNASYVMESETGQLKPIKVPSDELKLGGFEVTNEAQQAFIVEFGLRQSMTYNPGPDRYILKPRGVRVVAAVSALHINGEVDLAAIHQVEPCSAKPDSGVNNVAYLYEGTGLDASLLGDVFVVEDADTESPEIDTNVSADIIAPLVSANVDSDGKFIFSYVEPGNYTIAYSCDVEDDDPVLFDGYEIPSPPGALTEVSLSAESVVCAFSSESTSCTELTEEDSEMDADSSSE